MQCQAREGNLTVTCIPRVGILIGRHAFDLSISNSRREVDHLFLIILAIIFCPGVGILIIFFRKCQNSHRTPDPPTLGLDIDRCITIKSLWSSCTWFSLNNTLKRLNSPLPRQEPRLSQEGGFTQNMQMGYLFHASCIKKVRNFRS